MGACWAGMGRVAVLDDLDGDGSGALPRDDEPPLEPLGIIIRKYCSQNYRLSNSFIPIFSRI